MAKIANAPKLEITLRSIATELREHPHHWTKGEMARDSKGYSIDPRDEEAVCWCTLGLLERDIKDFAVRNAIVDLFGLDVHAGDYNDEPERTAADIADLFDLAAEKVVL